MHDDDDDDDDDVITHPILPVYRDLIRTGDLTVSLLASPLTDRIVIFFLNFWLKF